MPKQKLYTAKELSIELNVSVTRIGQLVSKYIAEETYEYVDNTGYPKKFTQKTLTLLKAKQKENSKFQKFRK